jgi:hypothetical protein
MPLDLPGVAEDLIDHAILTEAQILQLRQFRQHRERVGGLMYSSGGARTQDQPAFVVEDSQASISITEANFSHNAYRSLIQVKKAGATVFELLRGQTPGSAGGSQIPLWATP